MNIKEKDSQVTRSGNVKFFSSGDYLFDTYDTYANAVKGYAERFPSIGEGDYKPAYACVESNTKLEIKAAPYANITFKNERDVPLVLDDEGNPTSDIIGGYMPVGRHYGFIYNEYTNARTIAHELGHGTNSLHHTFSPESETFYTTSMTDNLMDYNDGKTLTHTQWQWSHEKHRNVLGFLDDEGESENVEKYVVDKFVVLLNKVYSHNNATCEDYYSKIKTDKVSEDFDLGFNSKRLEDAKNPQQKETETTAENTETTPEEESADREDELSNMSDEDVKWLSEWAVRAADATNIMKAIWGKIYDAKSNSKIQSLNLACNRVYITKITYKRNNDEKQYNVAIYNMTSSETLSGLQKMSINNLSDLNIESIKKYMYIDKNQSKKYWLLSFVENGKKENGKLVPSLVIQISGSCTDTDISNILESLGILKQLKEEDLTTELRDICYSFNNKEYITPTDKVQMTKDKILKVKGSNLCIYDNNAKAEGNDINDALYTCIGSTGAMNWVDHFMTSDLDECPHIVRESDDNDYILEIVRAMKFVGQKGKKFSRKVDDKISKYGEMIALPNGKTISDVTLSINSKDLSFDINEDNIYESPEIREWTGKNNVMLGFGKKDGDKYPLEITCNWDCVKDLKKYIYKTMLQEDPIQKALTIIETYIGKTYNQDSGTLRTDTTEEALERMDCSELACRFLQLACGLDNVPNLTTADFADIAKIGSNEYVQYIAGSKQNTYTDIKPGDIFLWRKKGGPGHVGVVKKYSNDVVTVIEAISSSGSAEESIQESGTRKGCVRESKYTRTGKALSDHDGWKGYFRPKINIK